MTLVYNDMESQEMSHENTENTQATTETNG
jgi:hypothetical protein